MRWLALLSLAACSTVPVHRTVRADAGSAEVPAVPQQAEELGHVHWGRDLQAALAASKESGKPVLVLFDEVPGCSTVKGFGNGALTHPLLVEAVESLFEPVLVYNNKAHDLELLRSFDERAWNNPVVRILDHRGNTRARYAGPYTEEAFAGFLADQLPQTPVWLDLVSTELSARTRGKTATFAMGCFWSGEEHLGQASGVLATRTGWQGGSEVVEVTYDPQQTNQSALSEHARRMGARPAAAGRLRSTPGDDRHALRRTRWASVPMTPLQATRANAWIAAGKDPSPLFSPRQRSKVGGPVGELGSTNLRTVWR